MTHTDVHQMTVLSIDEAWADAGRRDRSPIMALDRSSPLFGIVQDYTCENGEGMHAVMRAIMALTGWRGMSNNYAPSSALMFENYIGTSYVIGLKGNTWLVEVHDSGWQTFMLRPTSEGLWKVRYLRTTQESCKPSSSDIISPTLGDFKALGITLLCDEKNSRQVVPHSISACLAFFGVHYLNRLNKIVTALWAPHGTNASIRTTRTGFKIILQPHGELMPGSNITRYEIFNNQGEWYVGIEGAKEEMIQSRAKAFDRLVDKKI